MRNAKLVLQKWWPRMKITETSNARWLLFVKANKKSVLIDLNSKNDICGILLFDGKKDPEQADMMNINSALHFYFSP